LCGSASINNGAIAGLVMNIPVAISEALIVEDSVRMRAVFADTLEEVFPGLDVTQAGSIEEANDYLEKRGSEQWKGIALVDLGLPDGSGVEFIRRLALQAPDALPIVVTIYDDDAHVFEAIAAGAKGYLLKDQSTDILAKYLMRLVGGEPLLAPTIARKMIKFFQQVSVPGFQENLTQSQVLTPREQEVLKLLAKGMRNYEVAKSLAISQYTVADYVKSIYRKLEICSRAQAALAAKNLGLL
jgi:DNA-binding NarL/FixJ family response regulator